MRLNRILPAFSVFALVLCHLNADEPRAFLGPPEESPTVEQGVVGKDKQLPDKEKKPIEKKSPLDDVFTQTPPMGNQFPTGFNPVMLGDFGVLFVRQNVVVTGTKTTTKKTVLFTGTGQEKNIIATKSVTTTTPVTEVRTVVIPYAASAAAFKVGENESPRPVDRVFGFYNYYGGIQGADNGPATSGTSATQNTIRLGQGVSQLTTSTVATNFPALPVVSANLHREVFGFEKTFLDGFASIELRVPFLQQNGNIDGFGAQYVGDVTVLGKYAFILDNPTGNVLSAGLAVTVPTGPGVETYVGDIHSTLFQPWFGYIWNVDRFFVQAFHSVVVPTDSRDTTLLFNDIALNFWLYRAGGDRFVTYLVPMIEVHVTTPLNHRSGEAPIQVPDVVALTSGLHIGLGANTTFSIGLATPVTGPRVYNVEAIAVLNWRF